MQHLVSRAAAASLSTSGCELLSSACTAAASKTDSTSPASRELMMTDSTYTQPGVQEGSKMQMGTLQTSGVGSL